MKTERELREEAVPWLDTPRQLTAYIKKLVKQEHDYDTCVYAMSMAAVAAFQYVAHQVGASGFQASCADLDVLRRTRGYEGPFIVLNGHDMIYPQYDLPAKLAEAMAEWKPWAAKKAKEMLAEEGTFADASVVAHWKRLVADAPEEDVTP